VTTGTVVKITATIKIMDAPHTVAHQIVRVGKKTKAAWQKKELKRLQPKNMAVLLVKNVKVIMRQTVAHHPNPVVLEVLQSALQLIHPIPVAAVELHLVHAV